MGKRGRRALRENAKLPRRAGFKTGVAFDKTALKSNLTLTKYRTGYRFAWSIAKCRRYMKSIGLKAPGSYSKTNHHGGEMFGLPREFKMTGLQAGKLLRHCFKSGKATKCQLKDVRKMLAYAWQLQTGGSNDSKVTNWTEVNQQWAAQADEGYKPPTKCLTATVGPTTDNLKTAFTTPFDPSKGMSYPEWCVGLLLSFDAHVFGARSVVDLEKIKKSKRHEISTAGGWMWTKMVGGRAKLEKRKGIRQWKAFRICLCPNGKHSDVPSTFRVDRNHTPENLHWCSTCPLNAFKVVRYYLEGNDKRSYPRWCPPCKEHKGRYSKDNYSSAAMKQQIQRWLNLQGANPDDLKFDTNCGRKSLGKLCSLMHIPYHESFEMHGDLFKTWKRHYQRNLQRDPFFRRRTQSQDIEECTAALWKIARAFGRGKTLEQDPQSLSLTDRLLVLNNRLLGGGAETNLILSQHLS